MRCGDRLKIAISFQDQSCFQANESFVRQSDSSRCLVGTVHSIAYQQQHHTHRIICIAQITDFYR